MTDLVPVADIERIVGEKRHASLHLGRTVFAEQIVYILHSEECRTSVEDLRTCRYSRALDRGIPEDVWPGLQDRPLALAIDGFGVLRIGPPRTESAPPDLVAGSGLLVTPAD